MKHRLQGDKKTLRLRQGFAETGCKPRKGAGLILALLRARPSLLDLLSFIILQLPS